MKKYFSNTTLLLVVIIIIHIFLLSRLIFFPYPELFVYPYLTHSGLLPYKEILDQHFPGLLFLPINFYTLGMKTPEIAKIWQYLIVIIVQIELFVIAKKIFKSNKLALLSNLIFLIWQPFFEGWVLWIDSILPIFYLLAFYLMLKYREIGKKKYALLIGISLGIAFLFKQVVLPLAFLIFVAYYLMKRKNMETLLLIISFCIAPALMLIYIYSIGVFKDFIYWTVTYNLTTFAEFGRKYPIYSEAARTLLIFGVALIGLLDKKERKKMILVSLFIIGGLFSAYARFDFVHLQPSLPFVVLGSVVTFKYLMQYRRLRLIIFIYILASGIFLFRFYKGTIGNEILFNDKKTKNISEMIKDRVQDKDKIFLYGINPILYPMTNTLPAGNVFVFQFPWFMRVAEGKILQGIIKDKPDLIVTDRSVKINEEQLEDFTPNINKYILSNYRIVEKFENVEFLVKN